MYVFIVGKYGGFLYYGVYEHYRPLGAVKFPIISSIQMNMRHDVLRLDTYGHPQTLIRSAKLAEHPKTQCLYGVNAHQVMTALDGSSYLNLEYFGRCLGFA